MNLSDQCINVDSESIDVNTDFSDTDERLSRIGHKSKDFITKSLLG